ncbi:MAG: hypothetical protein WCX69_02945 [Candidatus Paceibacterota bacterium]
MKFKTPLLILAGIIVMLAISIYWQFNQTKINFNGLNPKIPGLDLQISLPKSNVLGTNPENEPYKKFASADGALTFQYPSSFQDGKKVLGQAGADALKSNNDLVFSYRIAIPDLQPSYIVASKSNATSTQVISELMKESLGKQQCQTDIKTNPSSNAAIAEIIDAIYTCPAAQKDFGQWHSQIAVIEMETGIYTITAAATTKNWAAFQIETQTIFDSVANNNPKIKNAEQQP